MKTKLAQQFIRQQWRMWIETRHHACAQRLSGKFIRQQWRMWIETSMVMVVCPCAANSFASNGECGLKLAGAQTGFGSRHNSFASNGECGLKRCGHAGIGGLGEIHSPAMANVD